MPKVMCLSSHSVGDAAPGERTGRRGGGTGAVLQPKENPARTGQGTRGEVFRLSDGDQHRIIARRLELRKARGRACAPGPPEPLCVPQAALGKHRTNQG
jgi:hypothetical protein